MALGIPNCFVCSLLLSLVVFASCIEINSTEDLNKEETHGFETPWQFDDGSNSKSASFSSSSSKSHGEGLGKGSGYGASEGAGHGTGGSYKAQTGRGQKNKIKVLSYDGVEAEKEYDSEFEKRDPYKGQQQGQAYGTGYDGKSGNGYAVSNYPKRGKANPSEYDGEFVRPIAPNSEAGGSYGGGSAEYGNNKQEYEESYPNRDAYGDSKGYSGSTGSGYGSGASSPKRGLRKEFRKQGYQTTLVKDGGQGERGQHVSVFIKQLGNSPSSHQPVDNRGNQYGGKDNSVQNGYLLLPVVQNENGKDKYNSRGSGGINRGYSAEKDIKNNYGTNNYGTQSQFPQEYGSSFGIQNQQGYDVSANQGSFGKDIGNNREYYGTGKVEDYPQNEAIGYGGGIGQGKVQGAPPKRYQQQQQDFYSGGLAEGGNFKHGANNKEISGERYENPGVYGNIEQQSAYRQQKPHEIGVDAYGKPFYDLGSLSYPIQDTGDYNLETKPRAPTRSGQAKPYSGRVQNDVITEEDLKNFGLDYKQRVPRILNEEVKIKTINPNIYTRQRHPVPVVSGGLPQDYYGSSLPNFQGQRQVVNHGPMGISVSYKNFGNDLSGYGGLGLLNPYEGQQPAVGPPQGPINNRPYGDGIDSRINPVKNISPLNPRTKSIALFLQKQNDFRNPGGLPSFPGNLGGKMGLAGSTAPSYELFHGLNGMGTALMPMTLPFGYAPYF